MESFNRTNLKDLRASLQEAIDLITDDLGITVRVGNCSFSELECTFKVKCTAGDPAEAKRAAFERALPAFSFVPAFEGMTADHFGTEFTSNGETFRFDGLNTRAPKFPIQATRLADGRSYKFREGTARKIVSLAAA